MPVAGPTGEKSAKSFATLSLKSVVVGVMRVVPSLSIHELVRVLLCMS